MTNSKHKKRTLLYLASGAYKKEYETLPFEKVILVDKSSSYANYKASNNSKVEFWNIDALEAVGEIAQRGLVIDCLVSVNEGLDEGAGDYVIFSEFLMGYLSPYLADDLMVITDLRYYGTAKIKDHIAKMDWGFDKVKKLDSSCGDYFDPSIFSSERALMKSNVVKEYGDVFLLRRSFSKISKKIGRLQLNIIHGSIWKDSKNLDAIGLGFPKKKNNSNRSISQKVLDFFHRKPKTFPLNKLSILEILDLCKKDQKNKIGLMPWLDGAYKAVFNDLYKYRGPDAYELSFYHLNKEDYQELYLYFGEYFLLRFPEYFRELKSNENLWATFEEVLSRGKGFFVLKLCEEIAINQKQKPFSFYFSQIKLKSGKLKLYSKCKDPFVKGMIRMAEELSV